jgi:predicted dehydrogenase
MTERPLRVGLVGANAERSWAKVAHVPALAMLPGFALTAVATRQLASAEAAAHAFGAMEAHDDFRRLIRSKNVDIVAVCVRVPSHLDVVMAALEAGKHVMCEWPLGRDIEEAEKMAEAARRSGLRTCIGLQGRMAPAAQQARGMLKTGAIGRPLTASIYVPNTAFGPCSPAYLAYLMDPANGATLTTISGGHNIDLAQFLLGAVRELAAWCTIMFPDVELVDPPGHARRETPDRLLIQMRHEKGCVTALEIVGNRPPGSLFTFHIVGTEGEITLTGDHAYGPQASNLKLSSTVLREPPAPGPSVALQGPPANVAELYRAFGRDIREGTRTTPDFDHAVELTRLVRAVTVADESGVRQCEEAWRLRAASASITREKRKCQRSTFVQRLRPSP